MTNSVTVAHKTPFARWLFEHGLSARQAAPLFGTNRADLAAVARGDKSPGPQWRDTLAGVLLNEISLDQLRQRAREKAS